MAAQQATKKQAKPRAPASHPSFKEMTCAAIKSIADKKGPSRQAIRKYVEANYKVSESAMKSNFNKSLYKMVNSGVLCHPKTSKGRYKIVKQKEAATQKKTVKPKAKTVAKKKPAAKKSKADVAKKTPSKKPKAKKSTAAKKPVKKPAKKTVKKTAAKKPAAKKTPKKAAKKPAKKSAAQKKK